MADRAQANPKIAFVWNSAIEEVLGDKAVTGVKVKNLKTGELTTLPCQGMFVAIGHEPNTKLFKDTLAMDDVGYLKLGNGTRTNIEGVFACGDVADSIYRQAITAAGTGCMAAIDAERWLGTQGVH
jgi:thioredoxin reductase (NADPH)